MSVIAHRGASAHAPEHTFAAYDLALAMGADHLELDVRPLADGTLAVVHDRTLLRTCGDPRAVAELRPADLLGLDPVRRPLTLQAVLDRYGTAARYWVELKDPPRGAARRLLDEVDELGLRGHVGAQSFDHGVLRRLRRRDPRMPLAALFGTQVTAAGVSRRLDELAGWADAVAPAHPAVDGALVRAAHARGLAVHPYTVNDPGEMRRLLAAGADALITDVPDVATRAAAAPLAAA